MSKKMMMMVLLASVVVVVLGAAATALAASPSASNHSATKSNSAKNNKDFAGLVDIGGGREMYMECRGKGRPTVVFVSGVGTAPKRGAQRSTHPGSRCSHPNRRFYPR